MMVLELNSFGCCSRGGEKRLPAGLLAVGGREGWRVEVWKEGGKRCVERG